MSTLKEQLAAIKKQQAEEDEKSRLASITAADVEITKKNIQHFQSISARIINTQKGPKKNSLVLKGFDVPNKEVAEMLAEQMISVQYGTTVSNKWGDTHTIQTATLTW